MKKFYITLTLLMLVIIAMSAQNIVSYAYDYAGNRISRKVVLLNSNPSHIKRDTAAVTPVEEKLGDRKITVYPNPTKGALAVEISGGDNKPASAGGDEITISLFSAQGVQLQSTTATPGKTPVEMTAYPPGWYVLRIKVGEKLTEFKIVKQ